MGLVVIGHGALISAFDFEKRSLAIDEIENRGAVRAIAGLGHFESLPRFGQERLVGECNAFLDFSQVALFKLAGIRP